MNTKEAAVLLLARFSTSVKYAALFVIFAKLYSLTTSPPTGSDRTADGRADVVPRGFQLFQRATETILIFILIYSFSYKK